MSPTSLLLVPADRPERFGEAAETDVEAVVPILKVLSPSRGRTKRGAMLAKKYGLDFDGAYIRINPFGTDEGRGDCATFELAFWT